MNSHDKDRKDREATWGQYRDVSTSVVGGIPNLSFAEAELLGADKTGVAKAVREAIIKKLHELQNPPLFEYVETVEVEGCEFFEFDKEFREDRVDIKLRLGDLSKIFGGMKERNVPSAKLRVGRLLRSSCDKVNSDGSSSILYELGEERAETTLCHMLSILKIKKSGFYIFYIRDKSDILWAVPADWYGDDWYLRAYSVGGRGGWPVGRLVFSSEDS